MKRAWIAIALLLCGCGTAPLSTEATEVVEVEPRERGPVVAIEFEFVPDDPATAAILLNRALELHADSEDVRVDLERWRLLAPPERAGEFHRLVLEELRVTGGVWLIQHPEGVTGGVPDGFDVIGRLPTRGRLAHVAMRLLGAAGLGVVGQSIEDGPTILCVRPEDRNRGARLLLALPGAEHASTRGPREPAPLIVTLPPPPPRDSAGASDFEIVAYHSAWDPLAGEAVWSALLGAGIAPIGVDKAGGSSVSVPADQAAEARAILSNLSGVRRSPGDDAERLGRFRIAEPDGHPRAPLATEPSDEPRWDVVEFQLRDPTFGWQVATALQVAEHDPLGRLDVRSGERWIATVDVPAQRYERARSVLAALTLAWPPGTMTLIPPPPPETTE